MLPLGIYAWFGYRLPLEKRLKLIIDAGFDTTCLWFGHEEELVKEGKADLMPQLVREAGLILDNIHAAFWHSNYLWSESASDRTIIRQELSDTLSFCGKHHIPIMVMHLSAGENPPPPNKSGLRLVCDLLKLAEDQNVTIALENSEDYGNHYLDFVFSNVQSPNLGFCYDSSHDFIALEYQSKALEKWGSLLATTHLSDNYGINDDHLLPGDGNIDWIELLRRFPRNYKGALMLEVDGPEASKGFTPEAFVTAAYHKALEIAENLNCYRLEY